MFSLVCVCSIVVHLFQYVSRDVWGPKTTEIAQTMAPVQSFCFHTGEPPELPEPQLNRAAAAAGPCVHVRLPQMMSVSVSGWWLTYPSEKYEFVSWDD